MLFECRFKLATPIDQLYEINTSDREITYAAPGIFFINCAINNPI